MHYPESPKVSLYIFTFFSTKKLPFLVCLQFAINKRFYIPLKEKFVLSKQFLGTFHLLHKSFAQALTVITMELIVDFPWISLLGYRSLLHPVSKLGS